MDTTPETNINNNNPIENEIRQGNGRRGNGRHGAGPELGSEIMTPDALSSVAQQFVEAIRSEGNIRVVFGEPMTLSRHKIIPVARVEIGFGGGLAEKVGSLARLVNRNFGMGGGGEIKVVPIGFIHEDGESVQFKAIETNGKQRWSLMKNIRRDT